jgi:TrmH family RNA methyltransferase
MDPWPRGFLDAIKMADRAVDVLEKATFVRTLEEALEGMEHVVGLSRRIRGIGKPVISPTELRELIHGTWHGRRVGLLFGSEKFGLLNSQAEFCERIVTIPAASEFPSLNLSHSLGIVCYEMAGRTNHGSTDVEGRRVVPFEKRNLFYGKLKAFLKEIGFFRRRNPEKCMITIRDIFERSGLDNGDYNALMGMAKAIEKSCKKKE